ncbi:MAG: proline--tRNA ligase, partial [Deltaproteobacteria bacterium]|nr:proline--tRNA ligase [Deltaproteobacteria bacterium]
MRWSRCHIPTLKEAPADAEVASHKLLVRAGMIRRLTAGIYNWLPLGLRALNKAATIVREEMDRAGALEVFLPVVQPADLWKESGRWELYGKELLRFTDRNERECCLGPTHEEVVTDLLRGEVRSYRQLPLNLYQIQTKFRDEIRPRFGLMRGREFMMKDAYSFDRDTAGADASYQVMHETYARIFTRMGLKFRSVEADSGSIGGKFSREFMVLAETGEDVIAHCTACSWSSNIDRAPVVLREQTTVPSAALPCEERATPGQHTVEEVSAFLRVRPEALIKTLLYVADGKPVAALVRGDRELNVVKLKNLLDAGVLEMAGPEQVRRWTRSPVGFAGPIGLAADIRIVADQELAHSEDWITGANKADAHLLHVSLARDVPQAVYADLRGITEHDACPACGGAMQLARGIEVGHIFKLGITYSQAMNASFLDEHGKEHPMIMGCYGIGVSRVVAACIEQNHDKNGIIFPPALAPYAVELICLDPGDAAVAARTEAVYAALDEQSVDVLLDDREERPGVKFKDADLIGMPMQLIVGGKGLGRGIVEAKDRRTGARSELPLDTFAAAFAAWRS